LIFIVCVSLPIQRPGLETPMSYWRQSALHNVCLRTFQSVHSVMAAVRGRPSGRPGCRTPGFQPAYSCHPFVLETEWASSNPIR